MRTHQIFAWRASHIVTLSKARKPVLAAQALSTALRLCARPRAGDSPCHTVCVPVWNVDTGHRSHCGHGTGQRRVYGRVCCPGASVTRGASYCRKQNTTLLRRPCRHVPAQPAGSTTLPPPYPSTQAATPPHALSHNCLTVSSRPACRSLSPACQSLSKPVAQSQWECSQCSEATNAASGSAYSALRHDAGLPRSAPCVTAGTEWCEQQGGSSWVRAAG